MDVKNIPIDNIGLSNRSLNALHRIGVQTVGELMTLTRESLSEVRNLGSKSIDEIVGKITEYGDCSLRSPVEDLDVWIEKRRHGLCPCLRL